MVSPGRPATRLGKGFCLQSWRGVPRLQVDPKAKGKEQGEWQPRCHFRADVLNTWDQIFRIKIWVISVVRWLLPRQLSIQAMTWFWSRKDCFRTSLLAQWLRLCDSNAGGMGSAPDRVTKIPHAMGRGQKVKNKETSSCFLPLSGVAWSPNCSTCGYWVLGTILSHSRVLRHWTRSDALLRPWSTPLTCF